MGRDIPAPGNRQPAQHGRPCSRLARRHGIEMLCPIPRPGCPIMSTGPRGRRPPVHRSRDDATTAGHFMVNDLLNVRFPKASAYHPDWVRASVSGGANALWLTEWLSEAMDLRPGLRVLDLGCGRAASSVFLHREFGVQVWATDLWFAPTENLTRVRDAGVADGVFPLRAEARALPFATGFFDAIVSIDSFVYYGTDDLYLAYLA